MENHVSKKEKRKEGNFACFKRAFSLKCIKKTNVLKK